MQSVSGLVSSKVFHFLSLFFTSQFKYYNVMICITAVPSANIFDVSALNISLSNYSPLRKLTIFFQKLKYLAIIRKLVLKIVLGQKNYLVYMERFWQQCHCCPAVGRDQGLPRAGQSEFQAVPKQVGHCPKQSLSEHRWCFYDNMFKKKHCATAGRERRKM